MTDTQYDRALGDASALPDVECTTSSGVLVYTIGLALAVVLSAMSVLGNYLDGGI
jgi:cytochrome o ubiquinol oxidase subunit IV